MYKVLLDGKTGFTGEVVFVLQGDKRVTLICKKWEVSNQIDAKRVFDQAVPSKNYGKKVYKEGKDIVVENDAPIIDEIPEEIEKWKTNTRGAKKNNKKK